MAEPMTATELEARCREAYAELDRRLKALAKQDNMAKLEMLAALIERLQKE